MSGSLLFPSLPYTLPSLAAPNFLHPLPHSTLMGNFTETINIDYDNSSYPLHRTSAIPGCGMITFDDDEPLLADDPDFYADIVISHS